MAEENRCAAPTADVSGSIPIAADRSSTAHDALIRARRWFVVFFAGLLGMGCTNEAWAPMVAYLMVVALVVAHVFLGMAAARSGRSWVMHALLPVLAPVLGALISFGVLRSKVPYPGV